MEHSIVHRAGRVDNKLHGIIISLPAVFAAALVAGFLPFSPALSDVDADKLDGK